MSETGYGVVHVKDLSGAATLHLARPGDSPAMAPTMPGTMCGEYGLAGLVGIGPINDLREARQYRADWELCPRCFPHG